MTASRMAQRYRETAGIALAARQRKLAERFVALGDAMKVGSVHLIDSLAGDNLQRRGEIPVDEARHFPDDDVLDSRSGAQYFLHRHAAGTLPVSLHVHFFRRWSPTELDLPAGETISTHLAALELDGEGKPVGWFAVNQWVVGDYWRPADDSVRLFTDWSVSEPDQGRGDHIPALCHQWLAAYLQLSLVSTIDPLLRQRDALLDRLVEAKPGINVLEDREHEVMAYSPVDFDAQLSIWRQAAG